LQSHCSFIQMSIYCWLVYSLRHPIFCTMPSGSAPVLIVIAQQQCLQATCDVSAGGVDEPMHEQQIPTTPTIPLQTTEALRNKRGFGIVIRRFPQCYPHHWPYPCTRNDHPWHILCSSPRWLKAHVCGIRRRNSGYSAQQVGRGS